MNTNVGGSIGAIAWSMGTLCEVVRYLVKFSVTMEVVVDEFGTAGC